MIGFWALCSFYLFAQPSFESPQNYRIRYDFVNPISVIPIRNDNINQQPRHIIYSKVPVEITNSPKIEELKRLHQNWIVKQKEQDGFRIQIVSTTNQDVIRKARIEFSELDTDLKIYQVYDRPYYKLRVGDFLTKFEAEQKVYVLMKKFPAAFVVSDKIKIN